MLLVLILKAVGGANGIIIYSVMLLLLCDHGMIHNTVLSPDSSDEDCVNYFVFSVKDACFRNKMCLQ